MSEKKQNIQESLEQILQEVDNDPAHFIELSDAELVEIVGGAYLRVVNTIPPDQMSKITPNFTIGEENCGPGSCHSACNSWCHNWCTDTN